MTFTGAPPGKGDEHMTTNRFTKLLFVLAVAAGIGSPAVAGVLTPRTDINPAVLYWQAFSLYPDLPVDGVTNGLRPRNDFPFDSGGHEDTVSPHDWRRVPRRQVSLPQDVFRRAPLGRHPRLRRDALAAWTAPLRPVLGRNCGRRHTKDECQGEALEGHHA